MSMCSELVIAESLADICFAANGEARFWISENEVHYLKTLAMAADDDMVSCLLLRKLAIAEIRSSEELARGTVVMNSFVEFAIGGKESFGQLVSPSRELPFGISIASLLGAGLVGLRPGQAVLWPANDGQLHELQVLRLENCPGFSRRFGGQ